MVLSLIVLGFSWKPELGVGTRGFLNVTSWGKLTPEAEIFPQIQMMNMGRSER